MEFRLHGYGAGSHSSGVAKQYRNLRVKIDFERSKAVAASTNKGGTPRLFCSFAGITNKKSEPDNNRCSLSFTDGSAHENLYAANSFLDAAVALAEVQGRPEYGWTKPFELSELQSQLARLEQSARKLKDLIRAMKPPA